MELTSDELEYFRALGFDDPDIELLEQHKQKGLKGLAGSTPESAIGLVNRLRACQEKYGHTWTLVPDLRTLILANLNSEAIELLEHTERMTKHIEDYRRKALIPKIIKEEKTNTARKAAISTHKKTNEHKEKAITDWNSTKSQYSSIAGFARNNWKHYGITERTLSSWISNHERTLKKRNI